MRQKLFASWHAVSQASSTGKHAAAETGVTVGHGLGGAVLDTPDHLPTMPEVNMR